MKPEKKYGTGYSEVLLTWKQGNTAWADKKWICHNCGKMFQDEFVAKVCCVKSRPCSTEGCQSWTDREYYHKCSWCRDKDELERWSKYKEREWNGEPLTIYGSDIWFWDEEDLLDYCEEEQFQPQDLRLVFGKEQQPRYLDLLDYWCDDLPEDYEEEPVGLKQMEAAVNDWWVKNRPKVYYGTKERPTASSLPKVDYEEQINASEG